MAGVEILSKEIINTTVSNGDIFGIILLIVTILGIIIGAIIGGTLFYEPLAGMFLGGMHGICNWLLYWFNL